MPPSLPPRYLARLWHSPFARSVAILASGTAGAQAVTMGFAPLITRLYGPEAFGVLGTFLAIITILAPIAAAAYPIAIVLPREDRDAVGLMHLCIYLSLTVATLVFAALWVTRGWLIEILNISSIELFVFLVPAAVLFSAWMQIVQHWLIRNNEFGIVARAAVINSLLLNGAKAGIGWCYPLGTLLILLTTIAHALHAGLLLVVAWRGIKDVIRAEPTKPASLRDLAHRHSDFPLYRAPQILINAASQSLPVLMLAAFFGPAAAGFYALSKMVVGLPSILVGKSVGDVLYPKITEAAHAGEDINRLIIRATGALALLGIVPFGLIMLLGPWLFGFVFGSEWIIAGEYARWLALFFLFNFVNKPSVAAVPALNIQKGLLVYEIFSAGAKVAGLFLGFYWFQSDIWAIALFSVIGVIAYSFMILWILTQSAKWGNHAKTSR